MLTVITGPPCAGKSTYAAQHARPGDVVIDFDRIAQALGSPVTHGHDEHIWKVTIEARETAITTAVRCHHRGARVWIVDSKPPPSRKEWYATNGARCVDLTATPGELHRRASQDGRPAHVHSAIDQWVAGEPLPQGRPAWTQVPAGSTNPGVPTRSNW